MPSYDDLCQLPAWNLWDGVDKTEPVTFQSRDPFVLAYAPILDCWKIAEGERFVVDGE